jgi:PAS domain S-box-containing protein
MSLFPSSGPLFDNIPIGLYRTLPGGTILAANVALADILGFAHPGDLVGLNVVNHYLVPEDRQRIRAELERKGGLGSFELALRRRDGTSCWVRMTAREVRDVQGNIAYYEGAIQEIDDLRRLEQELRTSEAQYRILFEHSPQAMAVIDGETARYLAVNAAAQRCYGYTREEALAMTVLDVPPYEDQARLVDSIVRSTRDLGYGEPRPQGTWCHLRKDGTAVWAEILAARIRYGGRDAILVAGTDVTERVHAERERERYAAQLQRLAAATIAIETETGLVGILKQIEERARDLLEARDVSIRLYGREDTENDAAPSAGNGTVSALLRDAEGRTLGVLRAGGNGGGEVHETDQAILDNLARIGSVAIQNALLVAELRASRARLENASRQIVLAQEREQRTIARELHDQIGQMLTGLKLLLATSDDRGRPRVEALAEAKSLVDQLMARVHGLTLDLRPPALDRFGLLAALLGLIQRFTLGTGIEIDFAHTGIERRLPTDVETAAFRIVQEALTNVARHAAVRRALVRVYASGDGLSLQIEDEGAGFEVERAIADHAAVGLVGMRERASGLGGDLDIESSPGHGTRIHAELPIDGEERRHDDDDRHCR